MNDFDQESRAAVKEEAAGTIRWLFPQMNATLRWERWLDSQSTPRPGEPERRCDTIAEIVDAEGKSQPWACVIELFSGADPDATDRSLEYLGRFRRELRHGPHGHDKYPFVFALIFLTGAPRVTRLDMNLPGMEEVGLWFGPRIIDLSQEDRVAHLDAIAQNSLSRGLLCWAPLMRGGQSDDFVVRWRALIETEADEQRRNKQIDIALTFAALTDSRHIWEKGLEGLIMLESSFLRDVRAENTQRVRLEEARKFTLDLLEARFPRQVTVAIRERIGTETDLLTLQRWFKLAATSRDFAAFVQDCR